MKRTRTLSIPPVTLESPDQRARALLQEAKRKLGFVPNMYAAMANSPGLLETYMKGYAAFREDSGFSPSEQEVILLTISRENGCDYCVAAHSFIADAVSKVPTEVTNAIRDGAPIGDARLAALNAFVRRMLESRGFPEPRDIEAFRKAGFTERQALEVVLAIAVKTISNYTNHLFATELDDKFAGRAWRPALLPAL